LSEEKGEGKKGRRKSDFFSHGGLSGREKGKAEKKKKEKEGDEVVSVNFSLDGSERTQKKRF